MQSPSLATYFEACHHWVSPKKNPNPLFDSERFATWVLGSSLYATVVSHGHCVSERWAKASWYTMHALTMAVNLLRRLAPGVFQRITQEASMSSKRYPYPCWQQGMGLTRRWKTPMFSWKTSGRHLEDVDTSRVLAWKT